MATLTLESLEKKARDLSSKQLDIINDESRPWVDRHPDFEEIEKDLKTVLEQHAALKGVQDLEKVFAGGTEAQGVGPAPERTAKTWGQQVVESEAFQAIAGRKGSRFSSGAIELKNLVTTDPVKPGVLPATAMPGVVDIRFRRMVVRDLLAQGQMDNPAVTYLVEKAITNAADAVARGGLKPESSLELDTVIEAAKKIATTLTTEDEILSDLSFARSYIDGRLRTFVQLKEEDELLNGSGTGQHLTGLLNRTGKAPAITPETGEPLVDAIFRQITQIRTTAFLDPDGFVIHPLDWQAIRLLKDANGQYLAGGPFFGPYGNGSIAGDVLWGLPAVVTPAIAQGTVLVGAFQTACQVLQREGLTVEATNTNEDDFVHNRVTFRAEERLALAVYRPGALGVVNTEEG